MTPHSIPLLAVAPHAALCRPSKGMGAKGGKGGKGGGRAPGRAAARRDRADAAEREAAAMVAEAARNAPTRAQDASVLHQVCAGG